MHSNRHRDYDCHGGWQKTEKLCDAALWWECYRFYAAKSTNSVVKSRQACTSGEDQKQCFLKRQGQRWPCFFAFAHFHPKSLTPLVSLHYRLVGAIPASKSWKRKFRI